MLVTSSEKDGRTTHVNLSKGEPKVLHPLEDAMGLRVETANWLDTRIIIFGGNGSLFVLPNQYLRRGSGTARFCETVQIARVSIHSQVIAGVWFRSKPSLSH